MNLFLVRHGEAENATPDSSRPLSPRGRAEAERLAAHARRLGLKCHRIWQSGKLRAQQTAEILSAQSGMSAELEVHAGLAPDDPVAPIAEKVSWMDEDVCIVGHMPFMSDLASRLVAGSADASRWDFETCSMLHLERDDSGLWSVRWFVAPEMLPPA